MVKERRKLIEEQIISLHLVKRRMGCDSDDVNLSLAGLFIDGGPLSEKQALLLNHTKHCEPCRLLCDLITKTIRLDRLENSL
ncbi:MAG: hypothetical protein WC457_02350 [Patescibacteria group bacterium]